MTARDRARRMAALAAILACVTPVSARARDSACTSVRDATGDARSSLVSPTPGRVPVANVDRLDIVSAGMSFDGERLRIEVTVRGLASEPDEGMQDRYTVSWRMRNRMFSAEAIRDEHGWRFGGAVASGTSRASRAVEGAADRDAGMIALEFPAGRDLYRNHVLTQIRIATNDETPVETPRATASAPGPHADDATGVDLVLGDGCAHPLSGSGARCTLAGDATGDTQRPPVNENADPSIDIRAVRAATNGAGLVLEIGVARLDARMPDGIVSQRWRTTFHVGSASFETAVERDGSSQGFSWIDASGASNPTTGSIDERADAVSIVVPRANLGIEDGEQVTGIVARSADVAEGPVEIESDVAPDDVDEAPSYVAAVDCARQGLQRCPVVLDVSRDAGPIVTYDGRSLPKNQDALDITAAGADTTPDAVSVSMRLVDLGAPPPPGYDTVGYTVSWRRSDGRRLYAQAYKTAGVVTYAYGLDATPDDGTSGALFGGIRTTGTFDSPSNVVRISVPRTVIAGANLPRFGASTWALLSGNTVLTYKRVDSTALGAYRLGVGCSA